MATDSTSGRLPKSDSRAELDADHNPASTEVAQRDHRDTLPDDLNVSEFVGPYLFPDNSRRRWPGLIYLLCGGGMIAAWLVRTVTPVNVNSGVLIGGVLMIAVGLYHLVTGTKLAVKEVDALTAASAAVGFPVGHASAQLGWRGLLSRPTWRILLYSAEEPPTKRGIALVDAGNAEVLTTFTEDNPEDWSVFADGGKLTGG
jgi:hypothetical protein